MAKLKCKLFSNLHQEPEMTYLPPAYEVRRKVIFILGNVCLSTFWGEGVPPLADGVGGVPPSQVRTGKYPHPVLTRGSMPSSHNGGVPPTPDLGRGTPS